MSRCHAAWATTIVLSVAGLGACAPARALEPLGFYVGAGAGTAELSTAAGLVTKAGFKNSDSAYKFSVGVRPLSFWFGAELSYADFGSPSGTLNGAAAKASLSGQTAAGVLYLPIPIPLVDVYGKLGYTRVNGRLTAPAQNLSVKLDGTGYTAGAGVQVSLSSWSVRGEYEYVGVNAVRTDLLSISLVKTLF